MVRVITQETFNAVVKENMEEFDMTEEEAQKDAVSQFESQGVELSNIVTTLAISGDSSSSSPEHPVATAIKKLQALLDGGEGSITEQLAVIRDECGIDLAQRMLAAKHDAYPVLMQCLASYKEQAEILTGCLTCLVALMNTQPDLLDEVGISNIMMLLDETRDRKTLHLILKWTRLCCLKHEMNRQNLVRNGLISRLMNVLESSEKDGVSIRGVCMVFRSLTLDDDIRVPYGKAHEHAQHIAAQNDGLKVLTKLLTECPDDFETLVEVTLTLSSLCVRNEFCQEVAIAGGLRFICDTLINFSDDKAMNKVILQLLKVLSGNDGVKREAIMTGVVPLVISALSRLQSSAAVCEAGCSALAMLSLRNPDGARTICTAGAPSVILQAMVAHKTSLGVQKQASLAIRNLVARTREFCETFLELGAEEVLGEAVKQHGEACEDIIHAALRDLGCNVHLKELWTGELAQTDKS